MARDIPLKVLAKVRLGSCGTFPRPFSTFVGSIIKTCWGKKQKEDTLNILGCSFQRVVCKRTQTCASENIRNINLLHVFWITGRKWKKVLCFLHQGLRMESLDTFAEDQPRPFMRSSFHLKKSHSPDFMSHCPHEEVGQEHFSVSARITDLFVRPLNWSTSVWETRKYRIGGGARGQTSFPLDFQ